jgi:hypothetical protein
MFVLVGGSGGTAPPIFNLDTRQWQVVNFLPVPTEREAVLYTRRVWAFGRREIFVAVNKIQ